MTTRNLPTEGYTLRATSTLNLFEVVKPNGETYNLNPVEGHCSCRASVECCHLKQWKSLYFHTLSVLDMKQQAVVGKFIREQRALGWTTSKEITKRLNLGLCPAYEAILAEEIRLISAYEEISESLTYVRKAA